MKNKDQIKDEILNHYRTYNQVKDPKESDKLMDDLGMDSLDMVENTMMMEEIFEIEVPDAIAEKWKTVGDVIDSVELILKAKAQT